MPNDERTRGPRNGREAVERSTIRMPAEGRLEGRVFVERGVPAESVTLRFYERGFGGELRPVGETVTAPDGSYTLEQPELREQAHLEVRVVDPSGEELTVVAPAAGAGEATATNLVLPADAPVSLRAEHARLLQDLQPHLGERALVDAREGGDRRDITLLHEATDWDARLIALAATAEDVAQRSGLDPQAAYGALRAGLPTDQVLLARVTREGFAQALHEAARAAIIDLDDGQIDAAADAFERWAGDARRRTAAPGALSAYGEMLALAGVEEDQQATLERVLTSHTGAIDELWGRLDAEGLSADRIRLTARLGFLTIDNAPLIRSLLDEAGSPDELASTLVGHGLYDADAWEQRIRDTAAEAGAELGALIPPAYSGATTEERLEAYTTDLALKVRRSYPTQVVSQRVRSESLDFGSELASGREEIATVLDRAAAQGFSLGRTPLNRFVIDHEAELFDGLEPDRAAAVTADVKKLQRLYQVTPNDESLQVLLSLDFESAHDIASMSQSRFVERYGHRFATIAEAGLIWRKAQQVTSVTYTFLGAAKQAASAPELGVVPTSPGAGPASDELRSQFPTMEGLFGSLDYCECEHCRSVLGPAAYLVDILRFLDPDATRWDDELSYWRDTHGNATYPFETSQAWEDAGEPTPRTPFAVLDARRPDLAQLPLTCENTNTALPYIDVVNEILEYYVVHRALGPGVAYDTGQAESADLIAEPQHLLPGAYDTLRQARYPLTLPFDLWLETARQFAAHFETPFWELLDVFKPTDELYAAGPSVHGRAAVLLERLGFSSAEFELLSAPDVQVGWRESYGFDPDNVTEADALTALAEAPTLARRLGVDYHELVALLKTRFVNPSLGTLATLRKLGVATEDVLRYQGEPGHAALPADDRAAFEDALGTAGVAWLEQAWTRGDFRRILVLADPTADCGFEHTTLRHADGSAADAMAFVLLNTFVRAWRRLGWSIEHTDRVLTTFLPSTPDPRTSTTLGPALASALIGAGHLVHLAELLEVRPRTRELLPALWSPIDDAQYRRLFLSSGEGADPVFDHPLGRYLTFLDDSEHRPFAYDPSLPEDAATGNVPLHTHVAAVQAALQLSGGEVDAILRHTGQQPSTAPLDLATLSTLHRYALLARLLGVSVGDVIALSSLSGIDPFPALHDGPVTDTAHDHPYRHTVWFVRTALALADAGLDIPVLEFITRHRFDPVGPRRAAAQPPLVLVRTLVAEVDRIRREHAVPADPLTFTDDVIARTVSLVLPPEVAASFVAAWTGQQPLDAAVFDEHLLRRTVPVVGEVGFLDASDAGVLFTPTPGDQVAEVQRRRRLAMAFLPYVQARLIRQSVVSTIAAALSVEASAVERLVTDAGSLALPEAPGAPLLQAYVDGVAGGLTRTGTAPGAQQLSGFVEVPTSGAYRLTARCSASGVQIELLFDHLVDPLLRATSTDSDREPSATTDLLAGVPQGFTLRHEGAGDVILLIEGTELVRQRIDELPCYPRDAVDRLARAHQLVSKAVTLSNALGLSEAELRHVLTNRADFADIDLGQLPTRPEDDDPARARTLFQQLLRLVAYVRLRDEMEAGADLIEVIRRARRALPDGVADAEAVEDVLDDVAASLATITRREPATVREAIDLLGISGSVASGVVEVPALVDERGVERVWRVLALCNRLGVGPRTAARWAVARPDRQAAQDVRDAVRARYDREQWRRIAKPIFDGLRASRRDALVAHVLQVLGLDRVDQLFEHFLVDPGTEPVVQTSRLRLAISSVQTFAQRCLLQLEPGVHPSVIDAEGWAWMKRYRVWEANRKIFLWPENWLEPEFRDDKTHLFSALESALFEGDIDDERAEAAFAGYLRGLEEISRLDTRAAYIEERPDPAANVLHVLARTFTSPHRYFYRTYASRMWTPWVPVTAEIQGDHVTIARWRGRVQVLWTTFVEKSAAQAPSDLAGTTAANLTVAELATLKPRKTIEAHLHWTEYFQGEWSAPTSSGLAEPLTAEVSADFDLRSEFIHAWVDGEGVLWVRLHGEIGGAFRLVSRNAAPGPGSTPQTLLRPPYTTADRGPGRYLIEDELEVSYTERIVTEDGATVHHEPVRHALLEDVGRSVLVVPPSTFRWRDWLDADDIEQAVLETQARIERLVAPFFLADDRHTFFAEPSLTEVTTIEDGERIILERPSVDLIYEIPKYWEEVEIGPRFPGYGLRDPADLLRDPIVLDAVTQPGSLIHFGDQVIGPEGGMDPIVGANLGGMQ